MWDLGFLGSPHASATWKWQLGPIRLSTSLEIVLEEGRCQGTPMWPHSSASTYLCHWQRTCSHPLFTAIKKIKEVEANTWGEMPVEVPRCLPPRHCLLVEGAGM